jgi:hypothetical protein
VEVFATASMEDNHSTPGTFVKPYSRSGISAAQIYRFYCPCHQNGAWQNFTTQLDIYRQVTDTLFPANWVFQICKNNIAPFSGITCALINPLP